MAENSFFKKLVSGLSKTRDSIVKNLTSVFSGITCIDDDFFDELEEVLIMGDLGVQTTEKVLDILRDKVEDENIMTPEECQEALIDILTDMVKQPEDAYRFENEPSIVFMIGVNGVGKTTSVGKLSAKYKLAGKKVMMAAADTFRAAAIDQLKVWSERADVPMITQTEGSDPSAVVFDAVQSFNAKKNDLLFIDTAGRLHNKTNLMNELSKMDRIITQNAPNVHRESWLVLDATTGQNAISQAKEFMEVAKITGLVLTKMDGSAKGGMVISIQSELGIPVKFIGVGEGIDDLEKFNSTDFIHALFQNEE